MPSPNRGAVWLVDLGLAAKVRPCLVLSVPLEASSRRGGKPAKLARPAFDHFRIKEPLARPLLARPAGEGVRPARTR